MGDNLDESYAYPGNMRPSHRPESVKEVLDIIQRQNHHSIHPASQSGDVAKNRNPLPAIKGSGPPTPRQIQDASDENTLDQPAGFQFEYSRINHHDDLRKHTKRLNLDGHHHHVGNDIMSKTIDLSSALQREGTRHQLPPLSLRCESRGNNTYSDKSTDDFKRGTTSGANGLDSHTQQARPSTGYGRRLRAASFGDEHDNDSAVARGDERTSITREKSFTTEQRPRSSYGTRSRLSREATEDTLDSIAAHRTKATTNAKHDDSNTKHATNNKHRPLRVTRSHEPDCDYSADQGQERNPSHDIPNSTVFRPKSSKGRNRMAPSPRVCRPDYEGSSPREMDVARPGAPTPPRETLDNRTDLNRDSFEGNHMSRLMTL